MSLCFAPSTAELIEDQWDLSMAEWAKRDYSKTEIDRMAADVLTPWWSAPAAPRPDDLVRAWGVVQNWRTCHGLPLNVFQAGLRLRARRVDEEHIVAQRVKRMTSVLNKLIREPQMRASQMQDLGGCRAIMPTIAAVDSLYGLYRGDAPLNDTETSLRCYDYIRHPKDDGYRGIHIVARYRARKPSREPWNGQKIEIQLRSRLQHAFATAVETVTTFTREPLKFGAGPQEWRRFFALASSALAVREGTTLVPGTPHDERELVRELVDVSRRLRVRQKLRGWTDAIRAFPRKNTIDFKWLLLALNMETNTIQVEGYSNRKLAERALADIERSQTPNLDAVLVWVDSVSDLRAAYPNYYADTKEFLGALDQAVRPRGRMKS